MKNMFLYGTSGLFFVLVLTSCVEQKSYTEAECNRLSMEGFKGIPKSAHLAKNHCKHVHITYTSDHCQKALVEMVLKPNPDYLKEKYGSEIFHCFSENDLQKILKQPVVR